MVVQAEQKDSDEKIVEIELERLRTFVNHPFHVEMDGQMKELQDSIKKYGIITPIIVRPRKEGFYEIISGHRRRFAAEKLRYRKVPTIIRLSEAARRFIFRSATTFPGRKHLRENILLCFRSEMLIRK